MGILAWLVVGAIAGWLADFFVGGESVGLLGDIVIGIIGAFVGGWAAGRFFGIQNAISGFNLTTVVVAFLGAAVVLIIANIVS
jgi:uncharacterized membrane protein YeaQ/YmgE (transglycosylase-associated protein family)